MCSPSANVAFLAVTCTSLTTFHYSAPITATLARRTKSSRGNTVIYKVTNAKAKNYTQGIHHLSQTASLCSILFPMPSIVIDVYHVWRHRRCADDDDEVVRTCTSSPSTSRARQMPPCTCARYSHLDVLLVLALLTVWDAWRSLPTEGPDEDFARGVKTSSVSGV